MIRMRKIKIGLIAAAVVIVIFIINNAVNNKNSQKTNLSDLQDDDRKVLDRPSFENSPKIDDNVIGPATNSGFVTRDPVTKKVVRKFGFEKLLNPEKNSEKWRLKNPYMEFFGDRFACRITSDEGNFQIEKVMNKLTPQNARLYGNVKLEITFQKQGNPTDGVIYLEDLDYDSEMSRLDTDKSVRAVFDDAVMEGTGMRLVYNSAKSRIEYFEMIDLDFIRVQNVAALSENSDNEETDADTAPGQVVKASENTQGPADPAETSVADSGGRQRPAENQEEPVNYYNCRFLKDVNIEYGDQLIVKGHRELNIKNLVFNQSGNQKASPKPKLAKTSDNNKKPAPANEPENKNSSVVSKKPDDVSEKPAEVILTCKEGFVIQLMEKLTAEQRNARPEPSNLADTLKALSSEIPETVPSDTADTHEVFYAKASADFSHPLPNTEYISLADSNNSESASVIKPNPTRFHAARIDYDMKANYAYADGPINLLVYSDPDPNNPDQSQMPISITAKDNAEYYGQRDQVVFNGEVEASRQLIDGPVITDSIVHGDQFVADLDSSTNKTTIKHLSVLGDKVELFTKRKIEENLLTHIRLKCRQIDYDANDELIIAEGPGVIEIDNSKASPVESPGDHKDSGITLKEPCFARIKDFDSLKWHTVKNKLLVDGTSGSVKIQHIPVINLQAEQFGKITYAAARNIEANFISTPQGATELADITASNTVSFKEMEGEEEVNSFIGDKLFYNAEQTMMLITSTEGNPCILNGYPAEKIRYNLATGEVLTGISGVAAIQLPLKPQ